MIGSVLKTNHRVQVYDPHGRLLFIQLCGTGPGDGLPGCTASTVSIVNGFVLTAFDAQGREVSRKPAR